MPKLSQSLSKYDFGFLKGIAQLWGLDQPLKDKKSAIEQLTLWLTDPQNIQHILGNLPSDALAALEDLMVHGGRLPTAIFCRKYGEIRQVGAGKRDREAIFLSPQNASERLYFHGLIFQDFFEGDRALEEYIYIPQDLLTGIPISPSADRPHFEAAITADQIEPLFPEQDFILDDLCTILAWLRMNRSDPERLRDLRKHLLLSTELIQGLPFSLDPEFFVTLLTEAGILDSNHSPLSEPTRALLSSPRPEALQYLYETWLRSKAINELKRLEQLECLGEWENDPVVARQFLIEQLKSLQSGVWYDLDRFIEFIHDHFPDFQRPAGNYEIWLIRKRNEEKFLKGFESWYSVEGELLRSLILGPLVWFGIIQLGRRKDASPSYVFCITQQGEVLLRNQPPPSSAETEAILQVLPSGVVSVPRRASMSLRYQVARFCEWEGYHHAQFHYRITPASLQAAQQNNLKPIQLLRLLQKNAASLPPTLVQALRRWIVHATEVQIKTLTILHVRSPDILDKIKKSRSAKYLHQILNPTTAVINSGQEKKIAELFLSMGYLVDLEIDARQDESPPQR